MTMHRALGLLVALFAILLVGLFFDSAVDQWVANNRIGACEFTAKTISRYLAWHWLMFGGLLGLGAAWLRAEREWQRVICIMMVAASVAGLSADFLRGVTGRTRPYYSAAPQGFYGVHDGSRWLITNHAFNSFPSGHTSAIAGFLAPLVLWRRRFAIVAIPMICIVAAARLYLGAHHLSDVLAGALLGLTVALAVLRYARKRGWIISARPAEPV